MADKSIVVFYKVSLLSDLLAAIEISAWVNCVSADKRHNDLNGYLLCWIDIFSAGGRDEECSLEDKR